MEGLLQTLTAIAVFIPVISFIVFIHEYGHYSVAKFFKVKIDAFSIGFGKEIFGWNDKSGTRWKICWLPLGGYVKMFGDVNPASAPDPKMKNLSDEEKKLTFHHKPLAQKAAIVAAGPIANFILTIVIFSFFFSFYGKATSKTEIYQVAQESAAEEAGLLPGDVIRSIDDNVMEKFSDIVREISLNVGEPITLMFERAGKMQTINVTPKMVKRKDAFGNEQEVAMLGIVAGEGSFEKLGIITAIGVATVETYHAAADTLRFLGQIIQGDRGLQGLSGPVGIAKISGQAYDLGFKYIIWLIAFISVNLGLINLFPIPVLDGGHLFYYIIEAARGKPMAEKYQEYGFRLGFVLLIGLAIFATFNDLRSLFNA